MRGLTAMGHRSLAMLVTAGAAIIVVAVLSVVVVMCGSFRAPTDTGDGAAPPVDAACASRETANHQETARPAEATAPPTEVAVRETAVILAEEGAAPTSDASEDPETEAQDITDPETPIELTPELETKLRKLLNESVRYKPDSIWKFRSLHVTDDQKRQMKGILEQMKPRMDAALGQIWRRKAELQEFRMNLRSANNQDMTPEQRRLAAIQWMEEQAVLGRQMQAILIQFKEEYMAAVALILTPQQLDALEKLKRF